MIDIDTGHAEDRTRRTRSRHPIAVVMRMAIAPANPTPGTHVRCHQDPPSDTQPSAQNGMTVTSASRSGQISNYFSS